MRLPHCGRRAGSNGRGVGDWAATIVSHHIRAALAGFLSVPSAPLIHLAVSVCCSLCIYFKINCSFVAKLLEWGFHFHLQQKTVASGIAIAIGIEQCNPLSHVCCPAAYASATAYVSCLPGSGQTNSCDRLLQQDLAKEGSRERGRGGAGYGARTFKPECETCFRLFVLPF